MAKIPFNVDAYTARLIGRENVSTLNGAILELVKNTYDADSSVCIICYNRSDNSLYIMDNGCGMEEEIIINNWMTIGKSTKKTNFISKTGRIQTGAKGIGRFALDRISDRCDMLSCNSKENLLWEVDWQVFDQPQNITEVMADLNKTDISIKEFVGKIDNLAAKQLMIEAFENNNTGTLFKLSNLREKWDEKLINSIKENLRTLIPSEISNIFKIYVFDSSCSLDDAKVLVNSNRFNYDYKLSFKFENSKIRVEILRNEFDFGESFDDIIKGANFSQQDKKYFCGTPNIQIIKPKDLIPSKEEIDFNEIGDFHGIFYFAKKSYTKNDAKKYYYKDSNYNIDDTFSGIKIYRDSFRVRPYGEYKSSNYDWLLLSNRKTKSPAAISHPSGSWKVSAEQLSGSLFISRTNLFLPDQANREGIVETEQFILLKELLKHIIGLFEKDRQYVFRKLNEYYKNQNRPEQIEENIREKNAKYEEEKKKISKSNQQISLDVEEPKVAVSEAQLVFDEKDEKIKVLEDENKMLRALATTGIVTNTYIHEFRAHTHELNMKIVNAKECIEFDNDIAEAYNCILQADKIRSSFTSWFSITIDSVRKDRRKRQNIVLFDELSRMSENWKKILSDKNINISVESNNYDLKFRCFPFELEVIISNLITNSVSSFEQDDYLSEKNIVINVEEYFDKIHIIYYDTGKGLCESYKENPYRILEQFETDKRNRNGEDEGTGMGMWIINTIINEYHGKIDLSKNKELTKGFWIKFILNK